MTWIIMSVAIAVFLVLILLAGWIMAHRGQKLGSRAKADILQHWDAAASRTDPHRRILEADAVVASMLRLLGYEGSMADKLKRAEKYIPDINAVWRAHKLRNRIAHEPGIQLNDREVRDSMQAFERVIRKFCA